MEYKITVKMEDLVNSNTGDKQYVTVLGTLGETAEERCEADFNVRGVEVTCTINSAVNIGEYRCVVWRTGGDDGIYFNQVVINTLDERH